MEKISAEILDSFKSLPHIGDVASRVLYNEGYQSLKDVAETNPEDLAKVLEIENEKAEEIVGSALRLSQPEQLAETSKVVASPGPEDPFLDPVDQLEGVGEKTAETLRSGGFHAVRDILSSSQEALSAMPGIGAKKAEKLIQAARDYCEGRKVEQKGS
jgi:ERCC4-type nuclease